MKVRPIEDYCLMLGDADLGKVRAMHDLCVEIRANIGSNRTMQDVLFNHGYELERERRPSSHLDLPMASWPGKRVKAYYVFAKTMLDLAERPAIWKTSLPRVATGTDLENATIQTAQGYDAERVECLQRDWIKQPATSALVRQYIGVLGEAFDEFALQSVLGMVQKAMSSHIPYDWKQERAFFNRIAESFDRLAYTPLDCGYYHMGGMLTRGAAEPYEKLSRDKLGRMFLLTEKEAGHILSGVARG